MIIGRLLKLIFLCLMIMLIGAEGLRLLEGNAQGWITVSQIIGYFYSSEQGVDGSWQDMLAPILNFSAFFTFLIAWCAMIIITAGRSR